MPELSIIEDRFYQRVDRPDLPAVRVQVDKNGALWRTGEEGLRGFRPNPGQWTLVEVQPREPGDEAIR